jgi:hypothetical protein
VTALQSPSSPRTPESPSIERKYGHTKKLK